MILEMTDHSRHTIKEYLGIFRDLITQDVEVTQEKISGSGIVVEIDESKFGKRKYHKVWIEMRTLNKISQRHCGLVLMIIRMIVEKEKW